MYNFAEISISNCFKRLLEVPAAHEGSAESTLFIAEKVLLFAIRKSRKRTSGGDLCAEKCV